MEIDLKVMTIIKNTAKMENTDVELKSCAEVVIKSLVIAPSPVKIPSASYRLMILFMRCTCVFISSVPGLYSVVIIISS